MILIRPAIPGDASLIMELVRQLADYEKLLSEVSATEPLLTAALFGPNPKVFCEIAEFDHQPVGFALWFYSFSTFQGLHGIYLEDLIVLEAWRSKGIGKALLKGLAGKCVAENLGRLGWSVLDWNIPSIDFYKAQGAELMGDWTQARITGEALRALAGQHG